MLAGEVLDFMGWVMAVLFALGDEWGYPAAGVCGGVCHPVPDVRWLPSCGSQGLLEGSGSSQAEGLCFRIYSHDACVFF